ncbi:hypothetical protein J6590_057918 [Homalodisca vitripennis]|nr:hypothetical protein J6590_057918 [Homalodisca vitripennis]
MPRCGLSLSDPELRRSYITNCSYTWVRGEVVVTRHHEQSTHLRHPHAAGTHLQSIHMPRCGLSLSDPELRRSYITNCSYTWV